MSVMLRPLTLGELLDRAFQIYRNRFSLFVGIAAIAYLPLFVFQSGRIWVLKSFPGSMAAMTVAVYINLLAYLICVAASQSATIIAVSATYLDRSITLREAYGQVSGMLLRIFFIMIGMGIGITVGIVLLIVPGIILFLMWALAIPVAVLEDAGLGESLSRSRELTAGHRFRVLVIYPLYFVLLLALETALLAPFGVAVAMKAGSAEVAANAPLMLVATAIVGYVIECLVTPILTISLSLMYYDERVRKEAFDIHLMMAALDEGPAQSAAAGIRNMRALRIAALLLLLGALIGMARADNSALSLADYRAQLQQLRESLVAAPNGPTILAILQRLPPDWTVDIKNQTFTISSGGLTKRLREYARERKPGDLAAITAQIDLLLADARDMDSTPVNVSEERRRLGEILARGEFQNVKGETWYDRLKREVQQWLAQLLQRILYSSEFPVVSRIIIWGLLAVALAVAAVWVVRNYRQSSVYTTFTGSPDGVSAKPWRNWQAEAQVAAQEGRWRDAVHLSYWAAISYLEAQSLWRPDRARTPREYLRLLPANDAHRDPLRQLTQSFEQVWYGTEEASEHTFVAATSLLERLGCR